MADDILSRIVLQKSAEVDQAKIRLPEAAVRELAETRTDRRRFLRPFEERPDAIAIIAEIKRASPSKGDIRAGLDPAHIARAYEKGGAVALSVLTDTSFFKGSSADLTAARDAVLLPVLRKDFLISPYQIYESAAIGADAVLLIVRILEYPQLTDFLALCRSLDLDALVEVHTPDDVDLAVAAGARLIGINNRNLKTFDTDIQTAIDLVARLTPGQIPVAASGIATRADIDRNRRAGINAFLIGETLVRADDPAAMIQSLING